MRSLLTSINKCIREELETKLVAISVQRKQQHSWSSTSALRLDDLIIIKYVKTQSTNYIFNIAITFEYTAFNTPICFVTHLTIFTCLHQQPA